MLAFLNQISQSFISEIVPSFAIVSETKSSVERIQTFMLEDEVKLTNGSDVIATQLGSMVVNSDPATRHEERAKTLTGIDLFAKPGDMVAVVGDAGFGKVGQFKNGAIALRALHTFTLALDLSRILARKWFKFENNIASILTQNYDFIN